MNKFKFCMTVLLNLYMTCCCSESSVTDSKQSIRNSPHSFGDRSSVLSLQSLLQTYPCSDLLGCMEASCAQSLWNEEEEMRIQNLVFNIIDNKMSYKICDNGVDMLSNVEALQKRNPHLWAIYLNSYNLYNSNGYSLLMYAVMRSDFEMIDFLKKSCVDVNQVDVYENRTALHKVVDQSNEQLRVKPSYKGLISWFVSSTLDHLSEFKNINPDIQDYKGQTALHIAVQNNLDFEIIQQLLVQFKIDSSLPNCYGQSARDIAQQYNRVEIVALLDKYIRPVSIPQSNEKKVVIEKRARSLSENDAVLVPRNYPSLKLNSQLTHISNKLSSSALTQSLMLKKSAEKEKDKHGKNLGIDKHVTGSK